MGLGAYLQRSISHVGDAGSILRGISHGEVVHLRYILGVSRSPLSGLLEMSFNPGEPFTHLSLRGARQGDVAISAQDKDEIASLRSQ